MRRLTATALIALICVACAAQKTASQTPAPSGPVGAIRSGSVAAFKAALKSMRGKPVVVNYWATWCDPCKIETPRLAAAARKYEGRVVFLGVDVQDDAVAARRFVRSYHVPYDSLSDPQRVILTSQGLTVGLPVTQFYDAKGKATAHFGELKASDLEKKIRALLKG